MKKLKTVKPQNKLVWLQKLARSKDYIIITDKESVMNVELRGDLSKVIEFTSQRASLLHFKDAIDETVKEMDKHMERVLGTTSKPLKKARKTAKKGK